MEDQLEWRERLVAGKSVVLMNLKKRKVMLAYLSARIVVPGMEEYGRI